MPTQMPSDQPAKWLGLPVIATIVRILCRELTLQNEYLRLENKILKSKSAGRICFTDDERRLLVDAALANGVWKRKSGIIQRKGSVDRADQGPLRVWKP